MLFLHNLYSFKLLSLFPLLFLQQFRSLCWMLDVMFAAHFLLVLCGIMHALRLDSKMSWPSNLDLRLQGQTSHFLGVSSRNRLPSHLLLEYKTINRSFVTVYFLPWPTSTGRRQVVITVTTEKNLTIYYFANSHISFKKDILLQEKAIWLSVKQLSGKRK